MRRRDCWEWLGPKRRLRTRRRPAASEWRGFRVAAAVNSRADFLATVKSWRRSPVVGLLALQRRFEGFPFFESFEAAFTVGLVGLMVAPCMILDQYQNVAELAFGLRKTAFH